jgi:hypothetical protein
MCEPEGQGPVVPVTRRPTGQAHEVADQPAATRPREPVDAAVGASSAVLDAAGDQAPGLQACERLVHRRLAHGRAEPDRAAPRPFQQLVAVRRPVGEQAEDDHLDPRRVHD